MDSTNNGVALTILKLSTLNQFEILNLGKWNLAWKTLEVDCKLWQGQNWWEICEG
jgi:hypothetical protein